MTIVIAGLNRTEVLAALFLQAYSKHWRPEYLSEDISNLEDAKKAINLYGFYHIEHSLGVNLSGLYFDSSDYDLRFGLSYGTIQSLKSKNN